MVTTTMPDYTTRAGLIHAIYSDDPQRPASAIAVETPDGILLVGWHSSNRIYDVLVFTESFRNGNLQAWQAELLNSDMFKVSLGCANPNVLKQTWAVCPAIGARLEHDTIEILRQRFAPHSRGAI